MLAGDRSTCCRQAQGRQTQVAGGRPTLVGEQRTPAGPEALAVEARALAEVEQPLIIVVEPRAPARRQKTCSGKPSPANFSIVSGDVNPQSQDEQQKKLSCQTLKQFLAVYDFVLVHEPAREGPLFGTDCAPSCLESARQYSAAARSPEGLASPEGGVPGKLLRTSSSSVADWSVRAGKLSGKRRV